MIEKASKLISSMVYDSKNKIKRSYDIETHNFRKIRLKKYKLGWSNYWTSKIIWIYYKRNTRACIKT